MEAAVILIVILLIVYILARSTSIKSTASAISANFYDQKATYPVLDIIEGKAIIEELRRYEGKWIDWPERELVGGGSWTVVPLYAFGKWSKHAQSFPLTCSMLEKINTNTKLYTAGFSKLTAGSKLIPHKGWKHLSNNVLRCHYGLQVDKSYIKCGNETKYQREGDWLIFDDSKTHSAGNESDHDRIVLIIDLARPQWVPRGISDVEYSNELVKFLSSM